MKSAIIFIAVCVLGASADYSYVIEQDWFRNESPLCSGEPNTTTAHAIGACTLLVEGGSSFIYSCDSDGNPTRTTFYSRDCTGTYSKTVYNKGCLQTGEIYTCSDELPSIPDGN